MRPLVGVGSRFAHTALVGYAGASDASDDPRRIFKPTVDAASAADPVGAEGVLDSDSGRQLRR